MSECPNCGSAARKDRYYGKAEWVCLSHGYGADYIPQTTEACQLIRSLREELAATQKSLRGCRLLHGDARDAERDRIADWLSSSNRPRTRWYAYEGAAMDIRNNEHRSDT